MTATQARLWLADHDKQPSLTTGGWWRRRLADPARRRSEWCMMSIDELPKDIFDHLDSGLRQPWNFESKDGATIGAINALRSWMASGGEG